MNYKAFCIPDICKVGKNFKVFNKFSTLIDSTFDPEPYYCARTGFEIFLCKLVTALGFKPGLRDQGNLGCFSRNFATARALSQCFFILRGRVSSPRMKRNELKGEMHAPVSRINCTLAFEIKAAFPKASLYFRP